MTMTRENRKTMKDDMENAYKLVVHALMLGYGAKLEPMEIRNEFAKYVVNHVLDRNTAAHAHKVNPVRTLNKLVKMMEDDRGIKEPKPIDAGANDTLPVEGKRMATCGEWNSTEANT